MIPIDKATWRGRPDDRPFGVYEIEGEIFLLYEDAMEKDFEDRYNGSGPFVQDFVNGKFIYKLPRTAGDGCYISV